jgi:hypothetical protein
MRQNAIGRAGNAVLLVHEQRHATQPGRDATGAGRESAERDRTARAHAAEQPPCAPQCARDAQRRGEQRECALAAHAADRNRLEVKSGLRHEPRLQAAGAAEPDHGHAALTQLLRHGDAREDVAAGAAGQDQHRRVAAVRRSGNRAITTGG